MIKLKSKEEIRILREGGIRLARVMKELEKVAKPGVSTLELDRLAESLILKYGGRPSFKNYQPESGVKPFPASLCVSLNQTIVHGLPRRDLFLKEGDIVSLDLGMIYRGLYTDIAVTLPVGKISKRAKRLIETTKKALDQAIKAAKPGNTLGDIGFAIQKCIEEANFRVIYDLTGHGVGYDVHEDPYVLNYGKPGLGLELRSGLVLALEPMACIGNPEVVHHPDDSFETADGSLAAHFEHTVAITPKGCEVLTRI